ncbi:MAG: hypothetical protein PWQ79_1951 [Thermococcaceae archaeon]|nr:hypothetical protein [Thermococcaceae archaeon]
MSKDTPKRATEEVVPTGIRELDSLLGGGLLEDSTLLVVYETASFGWFLAIEVFRRLLSRGGFGVVTNYSFPFLLLERYGNVIHYDVVREGEEGRLVVLDVFGSSLEAGSLLASM